MSTKTTTPKPKPGKAAGTTAAKTPGTAAGGTPAGKVEGKTAAKKKRRPLRARIRPIRTAPRRARRLATSRVKNLVRQVRRRWSRSMRLRVIATTMLLGLLVVTGVGFFLLYRIRDGLISSRQTSALGEARQFTDEAKRTFAAAEYQTADTQESSVQELLDGLAGPGGPESRGVLLQRAASSSGPSDLYLTDRSAGGVPPIIPASLRAAVNSHSTLQAQITTLTRPDGSIGGPALAVGSLVDIPRSGPYELYFIFPLTREQQILDLVQRTFYAGGVALVLLVGGVAFVVTRQVVTPVRLAAKTAEELASGRLDRRMKVRGQDDIARLGRAFNGMAASLERQIHQLEELSRVQRRFVSDVSHELRTPLTTIRMASELIHEGRHEFNPVLARSAELLQTQLDRFESLLGDLLEISRFDAGAAVLDIEAADVRGPVLRVIESLEPLAERRGSAIVTQLPTTPCLAQIDSRRVERIVRNLLGNAIEHGEGRPIEVQMAESGEAVAVVIRDHGVGIDSDELSMVFNRFWRADPARARTTGGTGLGLAIAQEDAHLHGGWLQAWGQPGVGAVFRLTLPRQVGAVLVGSPLPLVPHLGDPDAVTPPVVEFGSDPETGGIIGLPLGSAVVPSQHPDPAADHPGHPDYPDQSSEPSRQSG